MTSLIDPIDLTLLDNWQRDFPLVPRPFEIIAAGTNCSEGDVIGRLQDMAATGRITRVGATCAPNTVSASTLAAMSVPHDRIEAVAGIVGAQPGINHSYLRENYRNLWFVATGPDREHVNGILDTIRDQTQLAVLDLPIIRPFNIDLGFSLNGGLGRPPVPRPVRLERLQEGDDDLLQALTTGLPIIQRPYLRIAEHLGRTEEDVLERIGRLLDAGIISRFGVIVRHRALGWRANAMVVWDIEPERIASAGPALAAHPGVTLCYERRPVAGVWPYRLYCMIHGRSRSQALDVLIQASRLPEVAGVRHDVLFSTRCFKQTGALISRQGVAA
ncbi:Lrp/AsnC family transcriptional regulator (plasmid) [Labrenzia sp. 5N]|uniref:siroheme decarboxylase subunit beta n=1 Tax=Labrenzia sp. 5N TaxID=2723402 RepID=UPI0014482F69|nr:Lrp/AsnC family transcriptional regulator [Labrenzia sp. 5N]NKX67959.1 Lrp/AsnC family transcriptional regulator [Labrenzia sp. 5N]